MHFQCGNPPCTTTSEFFRDSRFLSRGNQLNDTIVDKLTLIAVAKSMGIAVDESWTVDMLNKAIAEQANKPVVPTVTAPVANATIGKSAVSTFRYSKQGYCIATLHNGVQGIVGDTSSCSLRDMLALKGSGILVHYKQLADDKVVDGKSYKRYQLEWSLE